MSPIFCIGFNKTKVDAMILRGESEFKTVDEVSIANAGGDKWLSIMIAG